jgi:hypothetical protein
VIEKDVPGIPTAGWKNVFNSDAAVDCARKLGHDGVIVIVLFENQRQSYSRGTTGYGVSRAVGVSSIQMISEAFAPVMPVT